MWLLINVLFFSSYINVRDKFETKCVYENRASSPTSHICLFLCISCKMYRIPSSFHCCFCLVFLVILSFCLYVFAFLDVQWSEWKCLLWCHFIIPICIVFFSPSFIVFQMPCYICVNWCVCDWFDAISFVTMIFLFAKFLTRKSLLFQPPPH